jgi:arsenite methyltransferase
MNRLTLTQLEARRDDRMLEVGFGGGGLLAMLLAATDGRVVGVDASEAMVSRARRRFRSVTRLMIHQASVDALPLEDASVDKACSVNSLYFWSDPAAALAELARVIAPGGRLVLGFEPPEELRKWPGHQYGFHLLGEEEVWALMEAAGFTAIRRAEGRGRNPDVFLCLTGERAAAQAAA